MNTNTLISPGQDAFPGPQSSAGSEPTFDKALSLWTQYNRIRRKGGTSLKYQFMIDRHLSPELGDIPLSQFHAPMINAYLLEKLEHGRLDGGGGLAPSYVRTMSMIIRSALQLAAEENLCPPLRSRICPPLLQRRELPVFSWEEQQLLERYALTHPSPWPWAF